VRHGLKVRGVHASTVPAQVVKVQAGGRLFDEDAVREAVCELNHTVTLDPGVPLVAQRADPLPAP
jgi:hypothetical protein